MIKNYIKDLNEQQKEAVLHLEGPLMIIAGAGSGKTKVLTNRIAHLLDKGISAFEILALTFTNKAASEMRERIEKILQNNSAKNLYLGTFHSVFAKILRVEASNLGYPRDFVIYDTDDVNSLLKTIINELNLDDKIYKPKSVYNKISGLKNQLITPEEYLHNDTFKQKDYNSKMPLFGQIFSSYIIRCFKNGAMDFDDLLLKMHELLVKFPDIQYKYQNKFKYIMIDEYQDTNHLQYNIVKILAARNENICVVGDDAQSIYSFRGATIANILQFENDYKDVKKIKLEQNYRSTQNILHAANSSIKNNLKQIEKKLWTSNLEGQKINLVTLTNDNEEGKFVSDAIAEQKLRYHFTNNDFAILYRTNAQSRTFEESLRRHNIPYKIYGGLSFYSRKEIKDIIAYLKFITNPNDEISLKRIINYPARGIGNTSIEKIGIAANEKKITNWEVLKKAGELGFKGNALESIKNFVTLISYFKTMLLNNNAYEVALNVGKHTGIIKEHFEDKSVEGVARYENIQSFLNSLKAFTETPNVDGELEDKSLSVYLQQISLLTDVEVDNNKEFDSVKLMTVHAAKGLEFSNIFIVGLEENIFPSGMSLNNDEDIEEERRLFYVAITRAKQNLWLCYCNSRYVFGKEQSNEASRFIQEIDDKVLDYKYAKKAFDNPIFRQYKNLSNIQKTNNTDNSFGEKPNQTYINKLNQTHIPSNNFTPIDSTELQENQRIEHFKFGFGTILKIEGSAHNPIATILFDKLGEKKIVLNYAKITLEK